MSNRSLPLLTPDLVMRAYAAGIFPMADGANSAELHWFDPPMRALIPLDDQFHISNSLKKTLRQKPFEVTLNKAFSQVIRGCAAPAPGRETTWINREITSLYSTLHLRGLAHSIEVWNGNNLAGGLYGVSLGAAFFGESMFSRKTNASKIALVYTNVLLRYCGFTLFDTQFQTDHLTQFGTFEVTRANYQHFLAKAIAEPATLAIPKDKSWDYLVGEALQPVTHIS